MVSKNELRVGVKFETDNQQLEVSKQKLNELIADLQLIQNQYKQTNLLGNAREEFQQASQEAKKLEQILNSSWNSKLGQLDIGKFNNELKQSGRTIESVKANLSGAGATGTAAFNNIASSILNTNLELKKSSVLLDKMALTMANTVRFGISSSIFNSMTGAISKAYQYAVDLDTSLNNIRIVSGQSAEQMEQFAKYANQASKNLGASTLDYTDASLIYYQQGLDPEEVIERTDITMKAANVLNASAQEVSEYMTAIWNNFDDGSKSLEYYADVLTALGASTASSSEEIAEGLSKFAAVGDTVGLSYEYATSALATVVAETRQSADTVGTAFKTLFARIQDLKLGQTLDDGTTLGKYSEALEKVGINIKDQNGQLKDMDVILNEMGSKWQTLNKDQQVALAQNVAGVRQYTQLVALMDHWDKFTANLNTANNATGALQKQQDIYMESTEAHLQKLSTEAERTYDILFDTKTVNGFADALSGVLGVFNNLIAGVGGGASAFTYLGSIATSIFSNQIGGAITRQIKNLEVMKKNTEALGLKQQIADMYTTQGEVGVDPNSVRIEKEAKVYQQIAGMREQITQEEYNQLTAMQKQMGIDAERLSKAENYRELLTGIFNDENVSLNTMKKRASEIGKQTKEYENQQTTLEEIRDLMLDIENATDDDRSELLDELIELEGSGTQNLQFTKQELEEIYSILANENSDTTAVWDILDNKADLLNGKLEQQYQTEKRINEAIQQKQFLESEEYKTLQQEQTVRQGLIDQMERQAQRQKAISATVQALGVITTTLTTISGIIKTINDDSLTTDEKVERILTTVVTTLPIIIPQIISIAGQLPTIAIGLGLISATNYKVAKSAGTAGAALWSAFWPVLAIMAAVAVAIAGVVLAVKALSAAYNKDANAAKRANEAAKELKDSNEELTESFNQLKNSWEAYQTAEEKLDNLTEGTQEWKDALKETNDIALELLNNLDGLSGNDIRALYSRDTSTGKINIDKDAMQKAIDEQQSKVYASNLAVSSGQVYATRAQAHSDLLDSTRANNSADHVLARGILNALTGPVGAFNNLTLGMREFNAELDRAKIEEHLDEFMEGLTLDEFQAKMDEIGVSLAGMNKTEIEDFRDSIEKMAQDADAASEKLKLVAQLQVDEQLGDEYDDTTKKIAADELTNRTQKLTDEYLDKITGSGISKASGSGNEIYKQIVKDLQDAGYNYDKVQGQKAVLGTDSNRSFTFTDENGQEVEKTAEWVAETVAASKAMKELSGNAKKASEALTNLDKNVDEGLSKGIKGFINNGNLENMTEPDFKQLQKAAGSDISGYLSKQMGVSKEDLKSMLGDDYEKNFQEAIKNYVTAFDKYTKNFSDSVKKSIEEMEGLDELTVTQQKQLAKNLEDARKATPLDDTLMQDISKFYKTLGANGELDELSSVLTEITDWSDVSIDELSKKLKEAGISTEFTDEELQKFIDNMDKVTNATKDFNSLAEQYGDIHKIIDNMSLGDTISEEDYNKLGSAAEGYFTRMLDGTYKLTKSATEFRRAIEQSQIKDFQKSLDNQRNNIKAIENASNYDFNNLSNNQDTRSTIEQTLGTVGGLFRGKNTPQYDSNNIQQQLEIVNAFGNNSNIANWQDKLKNSSLSAKDLKEIAEAVKECKNAYEDFDGTLTNANNTLYENELAILSSVSSLDEMKKLAEESGITQSEAAYQAAELNLHNAEKWEDIDDKKLQDYAKHLRDVAKDSDDLADSLEGDTDTSKDLARQIIRMNDGIDDLADNWKDWSDILKNSSESSEEYAKALKGTREALADVLDTSEDYISKDFVKDHMDDISKAAEGDADAIDRLHAALAKQIVLDIIVNKDFSAEKQEEILGIIDTLQTQLPDLEVGASLDTTQLDSDYADFENTLAKLIEQSGMTADQVNALLGQMGYEADFDTEQVQVTNQVPKTVTESESEIVSVIPPKFKTTSVSYQDGTTPVTQTVDVPKISAKGEKKSIGLKGLSKKAGGSYNNHSSKNKGGGKPSKSSGGGGSKAKEPNKMDKLDDQADRYHKVNTQITKVENSLKKLTSQEDKLVGAKLIANLNKQWAQLNTQVANYNEKLRIAQGEQAELRKELAGKGAQFNADGTISNYMEAFAARQNYVNSLIDKYNSMSAEEQEKYKETIEKAKEDFKEFQEDLDKYDKLISDEIPGLRQSIQDAIDQQIEINIKKFNMEVDITLNMAEAERDWNKWKAKVLDGVKETDILGNAKARLQDFSSYYNQQATASIQVQTRHLEDTLSELKKMDAGLDNVYGDNRSQALEDLQTYYQQLMEDLEGVLDLQTEIHQAYLDMMDEAQEKFDEQLDTYEMIGDLLQNNMKIVQLVYGEDSYSQLSNYYQQEYDNNVNRLDFLRQQKQLWADQMELFEEGSEEWQSAKEKWTEAAQELSSTLVDSLETAREGFENTIKEIFQDLNNLVTNDLGLDYVKEEWDLINKNADEYLDTINAVAGIRDLESKYIDAINDADSTKNQQRLNALMESELNTLRSMDKISQADLDRAELKYQIALAQLALEDAQQKKTQMRLRRDSQGNYSYQYTADEDAINKAKEELSNLYVDLYNFDKDKYKENLDTIYSVWEEYQQKMAEAALINDPEVRAQRELLIQQEYDELLNGLLEKNTAFRTYLQESSFMTLSQLYQTDLMNFTALTQGERDSLLNEVGGAFNTLLEVYGIDTEAFKNMTLEEQNAIITNLGSAFQTLTGFYNEDKKQFDKLETDNTAVLTEKMVPQWTSAIQTMADKISGKGGLQQTTEASMTKIKNATAQYDKQVETLAKTAGKTTTEIGKGLDKDITKTQQLVTDNTKLITSYNNELKAVKNVCDQIDTLIKKYQNAESAAKKATEAAYKYWLQEQQKQAAAAKKQTQTSSSSGSNSSSSSSGGGGSSAPASLQGNGNVDVGDKVTLNGKLAVSSYNSPTLTPMSRYRGAQLYVQMINNGAKSPYHLGTSPSYSSSTAVGWVDRNQISGYDTGGYTGEWDNKDGRLAVLHEKELVLNAKDTENMLNTVAIMRNLATTLGGNVLAKLAGVAAGNGNGKVDTTDTIEQNVHIDATFPGVKDAKEIEDALNNLVNSATQRIFEKR